MMTRFDPAELHDVVPLRVAWRDPEFDRRMRHLDEATRMDIYDWAWSFFGIPGFPHWAGFDIGRARAWHAHHQSLDAGLGEILAILAPSTKDAIQKLRLLEEAQTTQVQREARHGEDLDWRVLERRAEGQDRVAERLAESFTRCVNERRLGGRITVALELLCRHGL